MAKQIISGNLNALKALIEPFGWMLDNDAVERCSGSTLKTLQTWCEDDDSEEDPCPGSLWNVVYVPYDQRKAFKNENDVRALLFELLAYRADFLELAKNPDGWIRILADNMSHGDGASKYGSVFFDDHEGDMAVWFGTKENMLPWMSGENLRSAMNILLDPKSVPTEPTPETVANPKSTNRKTLATPPPAASVSGPKSGKTKMVAKKEPAPLIAKPKQSLEFIDIDCIESDPDNDRKNFDKAELQELADSIAKHGILQPINLRPIVGRNAFMIVAGERRWRAAKLAGLREIPAQIGERDGIQVSLARLDENLKRVDLSPIEKAKAMKRIMDEHQLTQKELGEAVGVEQGQVSNMLRLLKLPTKLQNLVADGSIAPTLIRVILPVAEYPKVTDQIFGVVEQAIKKSEPVETQLLTDAMRHAVQKHSRSMKYESDWQSYAPPDATRRHFSKTTPEQDKLLDAQEFKFLYTWEGQRRTFNVELFDEINKTPLKNRRDKHAAYREKRGHSATGKDNKEKASAKPFEHQGKVESALDRDFAVMLAQVIESTKLSSNRQKVRAVCLALLIGCEGGVTESFVDRKVPYDESIAAMVPVFDLPSNDLDKLLVEKVLAELRRDYHIDVKQSVAIADAFGVDLVAMWKPSDELRELLTAHGRELLDEAAGDVPEFLWPFFGIKLKAPAKKKTKAA